MADPPYGLRVKLAAIERVAAALPDGETTPKFVGKGVTATCSCVKSASNPVNHIFWTQSFNTLKKSR